MVVLARVISLSVVVEELNHKKAENLTGMLLEMPKKLSRFK